MSQRPVDYRENRLGSAIPLIANSFVSVARCSSNSQFRSSLLATFNSHGSEELSDNFQAKLWQLSAKKFQAAPPISTLPAFKKLNLDWPLIQRTPPKKPRGSARSKKPSPLLKGQTNILSWMKSDPVKRVQAVKAGSKRSLLIDKKVGVSKSCEKRKINSSKLDVPITSLFCNDKKALEQVVPCSSSYRDGVTSEFDFVSTKVVASSEHVPALSGVGKMCFKDDVVPLRRISSDTILGAHHSQSDRNSFKIDYSQDLFGSTQSQSISGSGDALIKNQNMDFSELAAKIPGIGRRISSTMSGIPNVTENEICYALQMGAAKEFIAVSKSHVTDVAIYEAAKMFLGKHFQLIRQTHEIMLFKHCIGSENPLQLIQSASEVGNGCVLEIVLRLDASAANMYHLPEIQNYMKPTYCDHCGELLLGVAKQGFKCSKCQCNYHQRCLNIPLNVCMPSRSTVDFKPSGLPHTFVIHTYKRPTVCKNCQKLLKGVFHQGLQCHYCKINVHKECANQTMKNCISKHDEAHDIPTPSITQPPTVLSGWLLHFTDKNFTWKRHFWVLDPTNITLFQDDTRTRRYKTIPLGTILFLRSYDGEPINKQNPPHRFELQTVGGIFYVAEMDWYDSEGKTKQCNTAFSAMNWLGAIQEWLLPTSIFPVQSDKNILPFRDQYQLHCFEKLGSGNFGDVYGGVNRHSQEKVAIKLIRVGNTLRNQSRAISFMNEIEILRKLRHPGIIDLKDVFEFSSTICIVTEKMEADMLCMIQSAEKGRLTERVTKFLMMQILQALRYLHQVGIAHRDLKPENVLVSSAETEFPMVKLCDFGYARIIGESAAMRTLCGTPAYLAPEVREDNIMGYDKSIDMWALGVVIYVTLSGTFPFNQPDDRTAEKISSDDFMFPSNPWNECTKLSITLIRQLLNIKAENRVTVDQCIADEWFNNVELVEDLKSLEESLGLTYLTSTS